MYVWFSSWLVEFGGPGFEEVDSQTWMSNCGVWLQSFWDVKSQRLDKCNWRTRKASLSLQSLPASSAWLATPEMFNQNPSELGKKTKNWTAVKAPFNTDLFQFQIAEQKPKIGLGDSKLNRTVCSTFLSHQKDVMWLNCFFHTCYFCYLKMRIQKNIFFSTKNRATGSTAPHLRRHGEMRTAAVDDGAAALTAEIQGFTAHEDTLHGHLKARAHLARCRNGRVYGGTMPCWCCRYVNLYLYMCGNLHRYGYIIYTIKYIYYVYHINIHQLTLYQQMMYRHIYDVISLMVQDPNCLVASMWLMFVYGTIIQG